MRKLRPLLLPSLLALAACGGDAPVATPALPKDLATFTVAEGGVLSGQGWDGVVEAVRRRDGGFVVGVQWHPEFLISEGDAKLFRAFLGAAAPK